MGNEIDIDSLGMVERRMWEDQQAFLESYAKAGTILQAAGAAHVSRQTVYNWRDGDRLDFKQRFGVAREAFRESLERTMFERLDAPSGNRGSDILLIFALKAHWREKYSEAATTEDDSAKDVLRTLMGWQQRGKDNGAAKDGGVKGHVP